MITIRIKIEENYDEGHYRMPFRSRVLVKGSNNPSGWCIGGWTKKAEGRLVERGPMVRGPVAYVFGLPTVIHNGPREEVETYELEPGDEVKLPGGTFTVGLCPRRYVTLTLVK